MPKLFASFSSHLSPNPPNESVDIVEYGVKTSDGAEIVVYRFVSKQIPQQMAMAAVLHMDGGGMMMGSVVFQKEMLADYVLQTGTQIFSVEYRLAPEQSGMSLVEDCYTALEWLRNNYQMFNLDPSRIAVMGESAGGGLAAAVALLARDRGVSPPLAKQIRSRQ